MIDRTDLVLISGLNIVKYTKFTVAELPDRNVSIYIRLDFLKKRTLLSKLTKLISSYMQLCNMLEWSSSFKGQVIFSNKVLQKMPIEQGVLFLKKNMNFLDGKQSLKVTKRNYKDILQLITDVIESFNSLNV